MVEYFISKTAVCRPVLLLDKGSFTGFFSEPFVKLVQSRCFCWNTAGLLSIFQCDILYKHCIVQKQLFMTFFHTLMAI